MRNMMHWCCGPDGRPDFDKMTRYMHRHDQASRFDAAGWALFFIWVGIACTMAFTFYITAAKKGWLPEGVTVPFDLYYAGIIGNVIMFIVAFSVSRLIFKTNNTAKC